MKKEKKRIYVLCADGKFVTATFWLGKPFCPLPFLSDCWVTISVVMEWNGMETDMAHTWIGGHNYGRPGTRIGWRLSLSLSLSMTMTMTMLSYLPTPTDTLVRSSRAYTRPLPRVTRVSADSRWWWRRWWMARCDGRSVDARPGYRHASHGWPRGHDGCDLATHQPPTPPRLWIRAPTTSGMTSPRYRIGPTRTRNTEHGGSAVCDWVQLLARTDIDTAGPNRAHDRPPSRTTKTATLYTNPATSWQIDVRDHVNTLIVVDLSKSQVD